MQFPCIRFSFEAVVLQPQRSENRWLEVEESRSEREVEAPKVQTFCKSHQLLEVERSSFERDAAARNLQAIRRRCHKRRVMAQVKARLRKRAEERALRAVQRIQRAWRTSVVNTKAKNAAVNAMAYLRMRDHAEGGGMGSCLLHGEEALESAFVRGQPFLHAFFSLLPSLWVTSPTLSCDHKVLGAGSFGTVHCLALDTKSLGGESA
ncbi:unnamed protein product, partial [Choristocarpus tenellus]